MLISVLTGFVAGALHVLGGADHLVAMVPGSLRKPVVALRGGLAWGLGHSTGVLVLSFVAIIVKDLAQVEKMSSWAEFSVGLALLFVGAIAIKNSLGLDIHSHNHKHRDGHSHEHVHFHFRGQQKHARHTHAATGLGLLHGLAGASHLLAAFPALALPPHGAIIYMGAYLFGSLSAMGVVVITISFATLHFSRGIFPLIVGFAGGLSIVTGLFWLQRTLPLIA